MEEDAAHSTGHEPSSSTNPTDPVSPITKPETPTDTEVDTEADTEAETPKMAHDSMVTVRLSEPPTMALDSSTASGDTVPETAEYTENRTSIETPSDPNSSDAEPAAPRESVDMPRQSTATLPRIDTKRSLQDELGECEDGADDTDSSEDLEEVNWEELEKTEDQQTKDEETDNVSGPNLCFITTIIHACRIPLPLIPFVKELCTNQY